MIRVVIVAVAVITLAAGGAAEYLFGRATADPADVRRVQEAFDAIPMTFGERINGIWEGTDVPYEKKLLDRAKALAHLSRRYVNGKTNETVEVLILAGYPRDMGAHDPTVCFAGVGFKQAKAPEKRSIKFEPDTQANFWFTRFGLDKESHKKLDLFWAWRGEGPWTAADNPRFYFASELLIQKIYISRVSAISRGAPDDPSEGANRIELFLKEYLPKEAETKKGTVRLIGK